MGDDMDGPLRVDPRLELTGDIDLAPAETVVGASAERQMWLEEMREPGGMSPGSSSRAHARAFRFADSLRRAGYRVSELPLGPRGGRRFVLEGYDGPRSGLLFRIAGDRDCYLDHLGEVCACFEDLTDGELNVVLRLGARRRYGYSTNAIACLVRSHPVEDVITAARLVRLAGGSGPGAPTLEAFLQLRRVYDVKPLIAASRLFASTGSGCHGGSIELFLEVLEA